MNPQILLAIDDENIGVILADYLRSKEFDVELQTTLMETSATTAKNRYDCCVISFCEQEGVAELIRFIRKSTSTFVLVGQKAFNKAEQIAMYEEGADDCFVFPIVPDLLICKIRAMLQRQETMVRSLPTIFTCNEVRFDSVEQMLYVGEETRKLSAKEMEVLLLLWQNDGKTVDRSFILKKVWRADTYFNARSLSVYITHLRNYFAETDSIVIMSIHRRGYKLVTHPKANA